MTDQLPPFSSYFVKAATAVAQLFAMAGVGVVLTKLEIVSPPTRRLLSELAFKVFIPCLLFTNILKCPEKVEAEDECESLVVMLGTAWSFFLLPFLWVLIGATFGWIGTRLARTPESIRGTAIAACTFGNATAVPLVLLAALSPVTLQPHHEHSHFDTPAMRLRLFLSYLSVYLTTYQMLLWSVGQWLISSQHLQQDALGQDASATPIFHSFCSSSLAIEPGSVLDGAEPMVLTRSNSWQQSRSYHPSYPYSHASPSQSHSQTIGSGSHDSQPHVSRPRNSHDQLLDGRQSTQVALLEGVPHPQTSLWPQASDGYPYNPDDPASNAATNVVAISNTGDATTAPAQLDQNAAAQSPSHLQLGSATGHPASGRVAGRCFQHCKNAWGMIQNFLVPPVIGILLGLLIGVCDPLRCLLVRMPHHPDAPFQWAFDATKRFGMAAVPTVMIVLGSGLSTMPSMADMHWPTIVTVCIVRLALVPAVAYFLCWAALAGHLQMDLFDDWERGQAAAVVAVIVSCAPTANNIVVMAELWGGLHTKQALAAMIFVQYILAPFSLCVWIMAIMALLNSTG